MVSSASQPISVRQSGEGGVGVCVVVSSIAQEGTKCKRLFHNIPDKSTPPTLIIFPFLPFSPSLPACSLDDPPGDLQS